MSGRRHPWGCTCRTHVDRPWQRSEHWSQADVGLLDRWFGHRSDEWLSERLGRSVLGIRLKARRLGLHKRAIGVTARGVAQIFGTDDTTVSKVWIRRGLLRSRRPFMQGPHPIHMVDEREIERFIREHPEWIDVEKMPASWYRDLAARDPWVSLPEVRRRTGRDGHAVARMILAGEIRGRRRGPHWYVPVVDIPLIRPLRDAEAIEESVFRRESLLAMRRNRRKGAVPRLGSGRSSLPVVLEVAS